MLNPVFFKEKTILYVLSILLAFFLFSCDSEKQIKADAISPSNPDSSATVILDFLNREPTGNPIKLKISSPRIKPIYREIPQRERPYKINIQEVRPEVETQFSITYMQNDGKTCKYSKRIKLTPGTEIRMNYDLNEAATSNCFLNFIGGISGLKWGDDVNELDLKNWEQIEIDEFTYLWVDHSKRLKLCFHKEKLFCYEKIFKVYPITPGPDRPSLRILSDAERELKNSQKPSEIIFNGNLAVFWHSRGKNAALIYYPIPSLKKNDPVSIRYNHVVSAVYLPLYNQFKSGDFVAGGKVADRVLIKNITKMQMN